MAKHLDGYAFDYCGPEEGRLTKDLVACQLPASYSGVPVYDCISYNQTGPAPAEPWCFGPGGVRAVCRLLTCSQGVQRACPVGAVPPAGALAPELLTWAAPACAEALCAARAALANMSACTADSAAEQAALMAAFSGLNASAAYPAALQTAAAAAGAPLGAVPPASLSAYCSSQYGQMCVDDVIDPACPAVFRSDNKWMVRTAAAPLCDLDCLRALCVLQQRRRHFNASTGDACADADLEMLIRLVLQLGLWGLGPDRGAACVAMSITSWNGLARRQARACTQQRIGTIPKASDHAASLTLTLSCKMGFNGPNGHNLRLGRAITPQVPRGVCTCGGDSFGARHPHMRRVLCSAMLKSQVQKVFSCRARLDWPPHPTPDASTRPTVRTLKQLLSPPPACAATTLLTAAAGAITDGARDGATYSGNTQCQWTVESPERPYISLAFSRFDTEPLYDSVTVEVGGRGLGKGRHVLRYVHGS
jgi:hypothetical protein